MSIAKKSVKWLAAAVVVFALVLTAVFAAGTVASASADPVVNNFVDVDAIVVATDAAQNSTYPSYLPGSVHTITAYYYFAMPDATGTLPNFAFAPGISYGDDVILPDSITLNTAFGESISVDDEILEAYLNEDATVFSVDAQIPDGQTIAYFAGVNNDVTVSGKYLFSAVYTIPADAATGVYTYVLGTGSALGVNSGNTVYIPKLNASSFFIRQAVQLPTAAALTYNGSAQIAITADDEAPYTVSGSSQINAGTYENEDALILALKDTNITIWDLGNGVYSIEPQSIDWSIAKKEVNVTFVDPQTYTAVYGAAISVVPSLTNDGILAADLSGFNFGYTGLPEQGDDVGSYPLTITYVANDNYTINAETGVNYVITKMQIVKPTETEQIYTYDDGNDITYVFASVGTTAGYAVSNNVRTDAGTYSGDDAVKAVLNDKTNTEWADGTTADLSFTFVINKKAITVPVSAGETYIYNGNPYTFQFTTASLVDQSYYTISNNVRTNAGTYSGDDAVKAVLNDTDNTMWVGGSIEDQSYEFVIGKATPVIAITTPDSDGVLRVYNGSAVTIGTDATEIVYEVTSADANVVLTPVWEISNGNDGWDVIDYVPTAAGSYRVYISAAETANYAAGTSNIRAFSITKANQTVTITTSDKIYNGAAFGAAECIITTNGSETPVLVTSSSTVEAQTTFTPGANADTYNFKVYIPEDANYNAYLSDEETVEIVALTVTVTPVNVASVDYTGENITSFTGDVTVYAVGGNNAALTAYLENKSLASLESALTYTLGANDTVKNAGTYDNVVVPTVTAVANDILANFNFDYATANVTVNKVANVISVFLSDGTTALTDGAIVKEYDAVAVTAGASDADIIYATLENDGTVSYAFYNDNAGVRASVLDAAPVLPGTYWIGLSATEGTNHLAVSEVYAQFVIDQRTITVTLTYSLGDGEAITIVTDEYDALSDIPAAPTFRYFDTDGFKFGGNVVTTFTLEMDGETLNAEYFFNVGKGDADGDGYVTARDIIKMKRAYAGLETLNIIDDAEEMDQVWALRESTGAYNTLFESALDVNSLDGLWPNDIVAVREALATGYDYKIIQFKATTGVTGQAVVYVNRVQVYTYDELVAAVTAGYPVDVMNDIDAATRTFDLDITLPADIDLKDNRLTVMGFALNTNTNGATLKIANGILYTVNGISVTAPNGNVIVSDVNGYSYDGTSVVLAAYSSSLHIEENVAFYIYHVKNDMNERVNVADFAATVTADNAIVELADTRMEETSQKMQEIAAIKADTTKTEDEKAEAINNKEVKKAIVEVPIDTHVVVEESANLTVDKLVVKEQSNTQAETVTTFSIEVKSTTAETVSVDITEVKSEDNDVKVYYVEEVKVAAEADKVEIIQAQEQEVTVKNYVAKIGSVKYETIDAAVAAAQNGDTITLIADVTYGTDRVVPVWEMKAFDIDLNGKTFTTNSNQSITASNNGYKASAICYGDYENTSPARNIRVYNGTIHTAYGAGLYFDGAVTATLDNLTVAQNYPANVQTTDEYSAAIRVTTFAHVVINSGTYSGKNAITISNSGGYVDIYGGDFRGNLFLSTSNEEKILTIYGGTFDHDPTAYVADGYIATYASDLYTVVPESGVVAKIDTKGYMTLDAAIAAANADDTIILLDNVSSVNGFAIDKSMSIDLNGKTVTVETGANVNNRAFKITNGTLTIYNGEINALGGGTTSSNGYGCYGAFRAEVGTNLIATDLTLRNSRPWGLNVKLLGATAELTNVNIISSYGGGIEVTDDEGADGTVQGYAKMVNCSVTQSGYFDHCSSAVSVSGASTLDVYSTDYTAEYGVYVFSSGGTINIYGGTFTALSKNVLQTSYDANYGNAAIINVYDGTFYGTFGIVANGTTMNVYGGTFDHDPTAYVADGYACIEEDGMYTIVEAVASVNGVGYATLDSAITAAESGDTVMVLANIALTDFITINSTLTVDLNGHTISTDLGSAYNSKGVFVLDAGANLTIEDSSAAGTGAITGTGDRAAYGISMKSDAAATLTINGGYIFGKSAGIYTNTNSGSVIINDGYIKSTGSQAFNLGWGETYLTVNGGTIESENTYAIWTGSGAPSTDPSTVTINAGKIITPKTEGAICVGAGNVVINGGDFTETNRIFHNRATSAGHNFTFVISGGTFASMTYTNRVNYDDSQVAVDAYVADGCVVTESDGVYTVVDGIAIYTFAELSDAIAQVNAGTLENPKLVIMNDIAFESELEIKKSVIILGDGTTKFIGYDASTNTDEAFYINVADEDQEIVIEGIIFDHFSYYSNVANKTKATSNTVKNAVSYITYGGNNPASTSLTITGCQFIGTARDMINVSSKIGCKGFIVIENCVFDATDRLSGTLNMLSFYGNADAELSVSISGCTFKEASEEDATWATSAIASFGNADITVTGCEFIACQIAVAIDNTFDRLFETSTYPVTVNTTVTLVENTYTNCYFGYYAEYTVEDASEIPEEAELSTDEAFTYGDYAGTQFHFAAEYDIAENGTQGVDAKYLTVVCYYVLAD